MCDNLSVWKNNEAAVVTDPLGRTNIYKKCLLHSENNKTKISIAECLHFFSINIIYNRIKS